MRINRYIVGCKYILPTFPFVLVGGINRYIVGCKFSHDNVCGYSRNELIDTQWDVNDYADKLISIVNSELIDTQWDVNFRAREKEKASERRINRYIVGCKSYCINHIDVWWNELIDTQWDVN